MSSVNVEDLSTPARIRTAAFTLFAAHGMRATTVRMVAEAAGVSAGLVIHHFGSKQGLRTACDEWLLAKLGRDKAATLDGDPGALDQMGAQLTELAPHLDYIVAALSEGGEGADRLFDHICDMTDQLVDEGGRNGTIRQPTDRVAWVTTLVAFSCGASMLGAQVARRLGGSRLLDPSVYARYALASTDLLTHGMFTDDRFIQATRRAMADQHLTPETPEPSSTEEPS